MKLTDAETQEQLRKMAIELIERAAEIEGKETMRPHQTASHAHTA
jgi:hypothetical protein